jgi:hypothetical protein
MTTKTLNIPYVLSIEIDYIQFSFIVSMEIDVNRLYFRLLLILIDLLRSQLFFVVIDINLFILLPTITDNCRCRLFPSTSPSIPLDSMIQTQRKKHKSVVAMSPRP